MKRSAKWAIGLVATISVLASVAYIHQEPVVLKLVGFAIKQRTQVGPYQEVTWSVGTDPQARAGGKRLPNIVLILADDPGWNDLTFAGGGIAGGTVSTPNIDKDLSKPDAPDDDYVYWSNQRRRV